MSFPLFMSTSKFTTSTCTPLSFIPITHQRRHHYFYCTFYHTSISSLRNSHLCRNRPSNLAMDSTPATFTLFPQLPTELRLKIYSDIQAFTPNPRILKISYSPQLNCSISNTPPPILLSISSESRIYALKTYSYLSLGPPYPNVPPQSTPLVALHQLPVPWLPIPINYHTDTLYISPLTANQILSLLHNLASPHSFNSLNLITSISLDLRTFPSLSSHGLLSALARMKCLRELNLVVEFGRCFEGKLGFLDAPEWRGE